MIRVSEEPRTGKPATGLLVRYAFCVTRAKALQLELNKGATRMLILTRRPEESIRIGEKITITLLGIKGNQVRIGIDAPRAIAVHRHEIYNRIQAEQNGMAPPMSAQRMRIVSPSGNVQELGADPHKRTE